MGTKNSERERKREREIGIQTYRRSGRQIDRDEYWHTLPPSFLLIMPPGAYRAASYKTRHFNFSNG